MAKLSEAIDLAGFAAARHRRHEEIVAFVQLMGVHP